MKKIIISTAIAVTTLAACNSGNNKSSDTKQQDHHDDAGMAPHEHATQDTAGSSTMPSNAVAFPVKEIISGYLQLKNALAVDKSQDAATAGNAILTAFSKIDKTAFSAGENKVYADIEDDAKEHSEHIGKNGGNIVHQREHFEMLSKDIYDLVKTFGGGQALYKDFCPMYNNNKGAFWISETKEIKNPYLGKAMPACGTVKEEIK